MMVGHANAPRAFVLGNAAYDEVFLVPALPTSGESVLGTAGHSGLGGKGANQAIALARTGISTTLVAAVGADWHGRAIREALSREPLAAALTECPDLPTDRSIVFAQESRDNVIVTTHECAHSMTFETCMAGLADARPGDAVLLQGNLRIEVTAALCRACKHQGLYLVFNPSPFDAALGALVPFADALFVNETEANELTGCAGGAAVEALLRLGADQVVLTLGPEGALLGSGSTVLHVPAAAADVVDVTGAGDCFEGVAIGSALLRGGTLDEAALRHASLAAAHTIESVGAVEAFPSIARLAALMTDQTAS